MVELTLLFVSVAGLVVSIICGWGVVALMFGICVGSLSHDILRDDWR